MSEEIWRVLSVVLIYAMGFVSGWYERERKHPWFTPKRKRP